MTLEKLHTDDGRELSYFELNLETWRQLWRVLEISDIILFIVDIRYPVRRLWHLFFKLVIIWLCRHKRALCFRRLCTTM